MQYTHTTFCTNSSISGMSETSPLHKDKSEVGDDDVFMVCLSQKYASKVEFLLHNHGCWKMTSSYRGGGFMNKDTLLSIHSLGTKIFPYDQFFELGRYNKPQPFHGKGRGSYQSRLILIQFKKFWKDFLLQNGSFLKDGSVPNPSYAWML